MGESVCCQICRLKHKVNFKDCKNCYNWLLLCYILLLICLLIIIILILLMKFEYKFDTEASRIISEELLENFHSGYFIKFAKCSIPSNNMKSSKIANDNLVKFGTWQGTKRGCANKADSSKPPRKLESGKECKDDEITLEEIPSQDIFIYKNISLCAITKGSYYDLLNDGSIIKKGETCPQGKKNCGYIDTLKNMLCFDIDSDCPIRYIKLSNVPPNITNIETIKGNKINIYYSNNPYENSKEIPYIQNAFKIADSMICSLFNLYYSSVNLFTLDAFKDSSENCIADSSERYHPLDKVDNYELYEENEIITKIHNSKLPNYGYNTNIYKDHDLTLYIRTHFGFDKTCLNNRNFDINELNLIHEKVDDIELFEKITFIFTCISLLLCILNLFFFYRVFIYSYNFIIVIINIIIIILYCTVFKFFKIDDNYEDEMTCSDDITNKNYNFMVETIRINGNFIIGIFGIIIFIVVIHFISIILMLCSPKRENEELLTIGTNGSLLDIQRNTNQF